MLEWLSIGFLYNLAKDALATVMSRFRRITNSERIKLREKWKAIFENQISDRKSQKLSRDVIIRNMNRIDDYPNLVRSTSGSSWFRAGLMGTYHRGILIGLGYEEMVANQSRTEYQLADAESKKEDRITVLLVGRIKYEDIESADFDGDEYYYFPHIYCYFEHKKTPFECLEYCIEKDSSPGHTYFMTVAKQADVNKARPKVRK